MPLDMHIQTSRKLLSIPMAVDMQYLFYAWVL